MWQFFKKDWSSLKGVCICICIQEWMNEYISGSGIRVRKKEDKGKLNI